MLEFEKVLTYTGFKKMVSKKGNEYTLLFFLDDNGEGFSVMYNQNLPSGINKLDQVIVKFALDPGRYKSLDVLSIDLV